MIEIIFQFGSEIILVKINGNSILFGNTSYGAKMADIEHMRLSKSGVEKEFPDLIGNEDWRSEAIKRFKAHIASLETEKEKAEYIIGDLKRYGYTPKKMQVNGQRVQRL